MLMLDLKIILDHCEIEEIKGIIVYTLFVYYKKDAKKWFFHFNFGTEDEFA